MADDWIRETYDYKGNENPFDRFCQRLDDLDFNGQAAVVRLGLVILDCCSEALKLWMVTRRFAETGIPVGFEEATGFAEYFNGIIGMDFFLPDGHPDAPGPTTSPA